MGTEPAGRNPYEAPRAVVVDVSPARTPMPRSVHWACVLLWVVPMMGILYSTLDLVYLKTRSVLKGDVLLIATLFVIVLLLTSGLRAKKNWARWSLTGLTAFVLCITVLEIVDWIARAPLAGKELAEHFLDMTLTTVILTSCAMVHGRSVRIWFGGNGI
jgi:hypothetical protein